MNNTDTICALATPQGKAGVGVIRLSGPQAYSIAKQVTHIEMQPRYAHPATFLHDVEIIDQGLVIYFPAPHSFTGEHVVEFHTHSNPFIYQRLLSCLCSHGARLAIAGEFSERAFVNGKLDLSQLEAIADLIASGSEQAARSAVMSMQGVFAQQIEQIVQQIIVVRTHIEASLDFSEEDIEIETRTALQDKLVEIEQSIQQLFQVAEQGVQIQQGVSVAITGQPNVGKSSLLNALCQAPQAIVTDVPGTTRDIVSADVVVAGIQVRLHDTAGIRSSTDVVEQQGIERAQQAIQNADVVIQVFDMHDLNVATPNDENIMVFNKADLVDVNSQALPQDAIATSAKTGQGIDALRSAIAQRLNKQINVEQTPFSARTRHLEAMTRSQTALQSSRNLLQDQQPLELVAEELRLVQQCLAEITGQFTPDDLLDYVFREFCIGK